MKKATSILAAELLTVSIGLDKLDAKLQFVDGKKGTSFFIKNQKKEIKQRYLKRLYSYLKNRNVDFKITKERITLTTNNIIKLTV